MSLRHLRAFAASLAITAVAIACSSVPDVTFSDDAGDPDTSIAIPDGAPKTDGSSSGGDASDASDAKVDTGPCTPSGPEICDDGIDNDCNGKIDCEDTACQPTHQCVDPVPTGWSVIAFNASSRNDACPTGYGNAVDVKTVTGTGIAGTCACNCSPTSGSCGNWDVTVSDTVTTCDGNTQTRSLANDGNCVAVTGGAFNIPNANTYGTATAPAMPATCGGTAVKNNNVPAIGQGRLCPAPTFGKGCPNNGACVRKPTQYPQVCITQAGTVQCPATGYTQLRTGGTDSSTDNRVCNTGSCTCSPTACGTSIQLSDQADCTVGGAKKTSGALGAACTVFPDKNFNAGFYRVNGATNGCAVGGGFQSAITGTIGWDQQRTICCKP